MNLDADVFFRSLADATRLRSLMLLRREGELCVCELVHALGMSQPKISRHLAQLREAGIVRDRRHGLWVYYALNPDLPQWAQAVLRETAEGLLDRDPFAADSVGLRDMPNRPGARCCA
jgi:ArsR family transcriptional regulator